MRRYGVSVAPVGEHVDMGEVSHGPSVVRSSSVTPRVSENLRQVRITRWRT